MEGRLSHAENEALRLANQIRILRSPQVQTAAFWNKVTVVRARTGCGMMDAVNSVIACVGDVEAACALVVRIGLA